MQSRAGKEREPLAPGSIPQSPAAPTKPGFQEKEPLLLWGLNPKLLLHLGLYLGPFQHLNSTGRDCQDPAFTQGCPELK